MVTNVGYGNRLRQNLIVELNHSYSRLNTGAKAEHGFKGLCRQAILFPLYTGLPNNPSPTGLVLVGFFSAGTTINFGMFTTFDGTAWAFSNGTDQASIVAFSDIDNSLGLGGSILQKTGSNTWVLHLDDARSAGIDDDDNDVLMELRVSPTKISIVAEPGTWLLVLTGTAAIARRSYRLRRYLRVHHAGRDSTRNPSAERWSA